jgi:hypothetical protein
MTPLPGDRVIYHGSLTEHHGRYVVTAVNPYSGRYALRAANGVTLHDVSPRSIARIPDQSAGPRAPYPMGI